VLNPNCGLEDGELVHIYIYFKIFLKFCNSIDTGLAFFLPGRKVLLHYYGAKLGRKGRTYLSALGEMIENGEIGEKLPDLYILGCDGFIISCITIDTINIK
jgi:hypothetical protein